MSLDPWSYAARSNSEHGHQTALFMWAAMAEKFGRHVAGYKEAYTVAGWAKACFEMASIGDSGRGCLPLSKLRWLHAVSNHGAGTGRAAEGVKSGVSDIFLPVRIRDKNVPLGTVIPTLYCGLYIELKRPASDRGKAGTLSAEQKQFILDMRAAGYTAVGVEGWENARDAILNYLGFPTKHFSIIF